MGKQPVKLKAVIYALSPFQQKTMTGLWKDLPEKIHHKVTENWMRHSPCYPCRWNILVCSALQGTREA